MTSVLVIGASGLLGQHLLAEAGRRGFAAIGTRHEPRVEGLIELDVADASMIRTVIRKAAADVVLLAAAFTSVDGCEASPELAQAINGEAPRHVALEGRERGMRVVHFSTDYVFDGATAPATEEQPPRPINVYGRTKAEGERNVLLSHPSPLVIRTSANFGWDRLRGTDNSVSWILRKLRRGEEVPLFADQWVTPSYAPDVARVTFDLLDRRAEGLFHVSAPDCVSRVEMGRAVCEIFELPEGLLRPVRLQDASLKAARPRRSCLAVGKVERTLNTRMRGFRDCLIDMKGRE